MAMRDAILAGMFGEDDESLRLIGRPDADDENDAEPAVLTSGDARLTASPDVRQIGLSTRAISGGARPIVETRLVIGHPRDEAVDLGTGELGSFAASLIREQRRRA